MSQESRNSVTRTALREQEHDSEEIYLPMKHKKFKLQKRSTHFVGYKKEYAFCASHKESTQGVGYNRKYAK